MQKTWKPTVAGILDIVAGALGLVLGVFGVVGVLVFFASGGVSNLPEGIPRFVPQLVLTVAVPLLIWLVTFNALAVVGGIFALQRKIWGLALAGSIAALFSSWPLGIAAIVLTQYPEMSSKNHDYGNSCVLIQNCSEVFSNFPPFRIRL